MQAVHVPPDAAALDDDVLIHLHEYMRARVRMYVRVHVQVGGWMSGCIDTCVGMR